MRYFSKYSLVNHVHYQLFKPSIYIVLQHHKRHSRTVVNFNKLPCFFYTITYGKLTGTYNTFLHTPYHTGSMQIQWPAAYNRIKIITVHHTFPVLWPAAICLGLRLAGLYYYILGNCVTLFQYVTYSYYIYKTSSKSRTHDLNTAASHSYPSYTDFLPRIYC